MLVKSMSVFKIIPGIKEYRAAYNVILLIEF